MNSGWSFAPSSSSLALSFWAWSNSVFSESFLNGGRRQLLGRKRITGGCEWIELMASLLRLRLAINTIWNRNGIDIHPGTENESEMSFSNSVRANISVFIIERSFVCLTTRKRLIWRISRRFEVKTKSLPNITWKSLVWTGCGPSRVFIILCFLFQFTK